MKRLQLEDLSKQLGYSKTLISMVLNGKADQYGISKKTQAIVVDAVSKLDYTPNKFAKALRTGKSNFIALIVADISNPLTLWHVPQFSLQGNFLFQHFR